MIKDIEIPKIDLDILNLQHKDLLEKIWDEPDSLLWGLVEMMDYILDTYYPFCDHVYESYCLKCGIDSDE